MRTVTGQSHSRSSFARSKCAPLWHRGRTNPRSCSLHREGMARGARVAVCVRMSCGQSGMRFGPHAPLKNMRSCMRHLVWTSTSERHALHCQARHQDVQKGSREPLLSRRHRQLGPNRIVGALRGDRLDAHLFAWSVFETLRPEYPALPSGSQPPDCGSLRGSSPTKTRWSCSALLPSSRGAWRRCLGRCLLVQVLNEPPDEVMPPPLPLRLLNKFVGFCNLVSVQTFLYLGFVAVFQARQPHAITHTSFEYLSPRCTLLRPNSRVQTCTFLEDLSTPSPPPSHIWSLSPALPPPAPKRHPPPLVSQPLRPLPLALSVFASLMARYFHSDAPLSSPHHLPVPL